MAWNEHIAYYLQPELKLYGFFCALNACKLWLVGAKKLKVEVDMKYIRGMINKLDIYPNAAINQWIAAILMFNFELVHVPGSRHKGPDGLLRRRKSEDDSENEDQEEEAAEEWVDEVLGCGVWVASVMCQENGVVEVLVMTTRNDESIISKVRVREEDEVAVLRSAEVVEKDLELGRVREFLQTLKALEGLTMKAKKCFLKNTSKFFMSRDKLLRKETGGRY
ncbi:hypothetical protein AN958_12348 [Leucoagaricus sp. SymC.cos]|nr:hypothetical protein AN958_12348 [Leucoagaricus sp. SymC.cos]